MSKQLLDRALYKKIKGFNKEAMESFLNDIYDLGRQSAEVDTDKLRERLSQIKGIGEKRLDEIMDAILDEFGYSE